MTSARRSRGSSRYTSAAHTAHTASPAAGPSPVTWPVVQIIDPDVATSTPAISPRGRPAEPARDRPRRDRRRDAREHRRDARPVDRAEARAGRRRTAAGSAAVPARRTRRVYGARPWRMSTHRHAVHAVVEHEVARREERGQPHHDRQQRRGPARSATPAMPRPGCCGSARGTSASDVGLTAVSDIGETVRHGPSGITGVVRARCYRRPSERSGDRRARSAVRPINAEVRVWPSTSS